MDDALRLIGSFLRFLKKNKPIQYNGNPPVNGNFMILVSDKNRPAIFKTSLFDTLYI